jgi:hypothetical protein
VITRADIDDRVRLWGLREDVVEKDYVLGWVLWGIGTDPLLHRSWVFKGGTCLKKCYIETYRFSEDLDFTVLEDGPIGQAEVLEAISSVLDRVNQESGVDFALAPPVYLSRPLGRSAEVRVYYRGPRNTPGPARIKFDLTMDEKVVCPPVLRPVSHDYPDALPPPGQVRNDELEIQSASYRILDDLAAAVHYGVATRDALSLMLGGIRSRRLANRVAESRAQAHLESWIRRCGTGWQGKTSRHGVAISMPRQRRSPTCWPSRETRAFNSLTKSLKARSIPCHTSSARPSFSSPQRVSHMSQVNQRRRQWRYS